MSSSIIGFNGYAKKGGFCLTLGGYKKITFYYDDTGFPFAILDQRDAAILYHSGNRIDSRNIVKDEWAKREKVNHQELQDIADQAFIEYAAELVMKKGRWNEDEPKWTERR